jgi:hypothetical protein
MFISLKKYENTYIQPPGYESPAIRSTILFGDNECETPSVDYNVWLQSKGSKHTYRICRIIV